MDDRYNEILLYSWANKHPYLFTLIEIANPSLVVILLIAALNVVVNVKRNKRR